MMRLLDNLSLRLRARLLLMLSNIGAIVLISFGYLTYELVHLRESSIEQLEALANTLEVTLQKPMLFFDVEDAERMLATLSSLSTIEEAHLFSKDYLHFASYWRTDMPRVVPPLLNEGVHSSRNVIRVVEQLEVDGEAYGYLSIASDMGHVKTNISRSITIVSVLSLVWLLVAYYFAIKLQNTLAGPVIDLSQVVDQVTREEDYSRRVNVASNDEVGLLGRAFNKLLGSVQARDKRLAEQLEISRSAEQEAQQSSARLEVQKRFTDKLLAHLPALYLLLDERLRCQRINDYALDVLKASRNALLERDVPILDFFPKHTHLEFQTLIQETQESGFNDFEINLGGKASEQRIFIFHTVVILLEDQRLIQLVGFDITDRYKLEQDLRQAQKMEVVGQLAGGVAHDFNNMLQAITGFIDAARVTTDSSRQHAYLDEALANTERAAGITRQLLAFGRKQALRKESVPTNQLLEEMTDMLQRLIGVHIKLEFQKHPLNPHILADRTQIGQVLMNLCINARDAMPHGGTISIATDCISLTAEHCEQHPHANPGEHVRILVKDTGHGMDPATQERIFEPFFTTKESSQGTGLGLAVVYGIIRQHNGIIEVSSKPGHGTTFSIYLPLASSTQQPAASPVQQIIPTGNETILFAEDEPGIRSVITLFLENAGYRVLLATNGQEAVETFTTCCDSIDLLLFDSNMPKLGGQEAYEMIANIKPGLPVIFSTGNAEMHPKKDLQRLPQVSIIKKPYRPAELLLHIRKVFGNLPR